MQKKKKFTVLNYILEFIKKKKKKKKKDQIL